MSRRRFTAGIGITSGFGSLRMLTAAERRPNFRPAVAPVTQSLGGVTGQRQHRSGVVRRGAVDTTPGIPQLPSATPRPQRRPRETA
jgi:hypothetical protein